MLIDQLPEITTANDSDEMPIEQGTTTRKIKILNLLKGVVKKAGDTMTGNLVVQSPFDSTQTTPSSTVNGKYVGLYDQNNKLIGYIQPQLVGTNGLYNLIIAASRMLGGSPRTNNLILRVAADGSKSVSVSDPAAWREALGLGTNGALPITIAQGGTGATTAKGIKENIGLDRLESVQYSAANGATANITLRTSTSGFIVCSGAAGSARELIWFNCTSTGSVSTTRLRNVSDGLTVTASTNKIAIANATGLFVYILVFYY